MPAKRKEAPAEADNGTPDLSKVPETKPTRKPKALSDRIETILKEIDLALNDPDFPEELKRGVYDSVAFWKVADFKVKAS